MSKMSRLVRPFDKQHAKRATAVWKSASQHRYPIHWSLSRLLSWKKRLLLTSQILRRVVNTLSSNEKYAFFKRDNLAIEIQMQLSQKQKTFSQFFTASSKSTWNFEYFEQNDDLHRFCDYEITGLQKHSKISV